jgi:hypothetical protein
MAQIFLPDNGQQFELDDDIAAKDDILKEALRPIYPEIGNAKISRETVDGVLTVKVVKQAGRKGAATIESVKAPAPEAEPVMLELERIRTDGGTQTRSQIDMGVTAEYAEAMKAGAQFPPVDVFYDGTDYWLADGFHRHGAAHLAGWAGVLARVHQGTVRNAILFSARANRTHGLRRSNADKRRAVETLLRDDEWAQLSNRGIGEICGVAHTFVGDIRTELSGSGHQMPQERQVQRGKQSYTFTPAAPQPKAPEPEPEPEEEEEAEDLAAAQELEQGAEPTPTRREALVPDGDLVAVEPGETVILEQPDGSELTAQNPGGGKETVITETKAAQPRPAPTPVPTKPTPTPSAPVAKALPWPQTAVLALPDVQAFDGGQSGGRQVQAPWCSTTCRRAS